MIIISLKSGRALSLCQRLKSLCVMELGSTLGRRKQVAHDQFHEEIYYFDVIIHQPLLLFIVK